MHDSYDEHLDDDEELLETLRHLSDGPGTVGGDVTSGDKAGDNEALPKGEKDNSL